MTSVKKKVKQAKLLASSKDVEPIITEDNYKSLLLRALNYHNYNTPIKKLKEWTVSYAKKQGLSLSNAPDWEFSTIGVIARTILKGQYIAPNELNKLNERLQSISERYKSVKSEVKTSEVVDIQKRMDDLASVWSEEIDYAVDRYVTGKEVDFSVKGHLISNNVSAPVAKRIAEYYRKDYEEVMEALKGEDEDLVEGYSHYTKRDLKNFGKFLEGIVNECEQHAVSSTVRKPRARKVKSPLQLVNKLKYMKEFENLKSVDPTDIIGAKEAWIYNTKYRRLMRYVASDSSGLTVKGSTLLNYSPSESSVKTLRKPEETLMNLSKRELNTAFSKLKTKSASVNGRVNTDCLILKAF